MVLDISKPLAANKQGAFALGRLVSDDRLGFTDDLWVQSLGDDRVLDRIDRAALAVARVDKKDWLASIEQTQDLAPQLAPMISLLRNKGSWQGNQEFKDAVVTFHNLSENKEGLFDRQLEIATHWLTKPSNEY